MLNEEGGVDAEEFALSTRSSTASTRPRPSGSATLACAQCHNHKYDPFTQQEFYRLLAFFNHDAT